jgi:hypothetical protein
MNRVCTITIAKTGEILRSGEREMGQLVARKVGIPVGALSWERSIGFGGSPAKVRDNAGAVVATYVRQR